ncbi:MAG: class I SAM-dependent methyltransferase [Eubacteriales bacterium]|nr:class I SAM-dependent methyltransferase [Eubacteriales bacterium]
MYSNAFCKVYNEFGWNYFPEAFGAELVEWIRETGAEIRTSLDLACGTGVLCEILHAHGIDAHGMDFSEGMITIARERNPKIDYEVADMITYRPNRRFDLVTCTGDALNHILDIENVEQIFRNIYGYLAEGGYFIFDILNEHEVTPGEPIDLDFSDDVKSQFQITKEEDGLIRLKTTVYEHGEKKFEEVITEKVHDIDRICGMLEACGFHVIKKAHRILDHKDTEAVTWYVIVRK